MTAAGARVSVHARNPQAAAEEFAADVRTFLSRTPRELPSRYFYDALGSALFDAICRLPWYHVTRAETRLLRAHARSVLGASPPPSRLVELGSGNGEKLATLVAAGAPASRSLDVHLVDVSASALATAARALRVFDGVRSVTTHEASYEAGLEQLSDDARGSGPTLVVFLGSNIGNFDPEAATAFVRGVRDVLRPGDGLLLGADLRKPEAVLRLAYDDPLGVTAAFNRNLLVRINRELGAAIDLDGFRHEAVWNAAASRVEMHLVSTRAQRLRIDAARIDVRLDEGERIWTESSYKYDTATLARFLAACGFAAEHQWIDEEGQFALTLSRA